MRIRFWHELDPTPMATETMDALEYSKILTNKGKWKGDVNTEGDSPDGETAWVEPWTDYVSNDAIAIKTSLHIPDIEAAGLRNVSLVCRLTYTF
jgi:hypothetical protein